MVHPGSSSIVTKQDMVAQFKDMTRLGGAGADQVLQGLAMHAWDSAGVLTAEDKQVLGNPTVTELGVRVDGTQKLLGSSPERLLKTMYATLHFIMRGNRSKKEAHFTISASSYECFGTVLGGR